MRSTIIFSLLIWFSTAIFYSYQYVLRVIPNVMMKQIMTQFDMDTALFGQYSGVYYIGYALIQIPVGLLLDNYGPRKVLVISVLLTVIGLMPLLFTSFWLYPVLGRTLLGIGSASAILGAFKVIRMLFPASYTSRLYGLTNMIGLLGAIYGGEPMRIISQQYDHKTVVLIIASFGVMLASLIYFIVPDKRASEQSITKSDIKSVLVNKKIIILSICSGLLVGPLECFSYLWGEGFLENVYNLSAKESNMLLSLIFVGACIGSPILTNIAEFKGKYIETIIVSGLLMIIFFILLMIKELNGFSINISLFSIGICSAYQILSFYLVSTYVAANISSFAIAVMNMIIMLFGYGFHAIIAFIIKNLEYRGLAEAYLFGTATILVALIIATTWLTLYIKKFRAS